MLKYTFWRTFRTIHLKKNYTFLLTSLDLLNFNIIFTERHSGDSNEVEIKDQLSPSSGVFNCSPGFPILQLVVGKEPPNCQSHKATQDNLFSNIIAIQKKF